MRLDFPLRSSAVVLVLVIALASVAGAQSQLPEGKGRDTVLRVCGGCHEADQAAALRLNRDGWNDLIGNMRSLGAEGSDSDFAEVLDYLLTHFPASEEAPTKLNINTASQVELESVAGLLRSQAAAVLKYVEKTPCKELSDLKKVQGLDYKKIEERKDLLVCAPPKKDVKPK
jgi:competence ComEA-like helix-hairpin-helix protein